MRQDVFSMAKKIVKIKELNIKDGKKRRPIDSVSYLYKKMVMVIVVLTETIAQIILMEI